MSNAQRERCEPSPDINASDEGSREPDKAGLYV
jgi:hypothetical protein